MNLLVDTHLLIWMHSKAEEKLSKRAKELLLNPENNLFYSPISVWEVYIKLIKHPNEFSFNSVDFDKACREAGITPLYLKPEHILELGKLKLPDDVRAHKDPMDRMLIAQARYENMYLITHDHVMPYYEEKCIIVV